MKKSLVMLGIVGSLGIAVTGCAIPTNRGAAATPTPATLTVGASRAPASPAPTVTVTATPAAITVTAAATTAAAAVPTDAQGFRVLNDKGWFVTGGLQTKDDGLGDFGGTARITNENSTVMSGVFTFTLLSTTDTLIASLQGSADTVSPGQTVTVQLGSQDSYVLASPGSRMEFQVDSSF